MIAPFDSCGDRETMGQILFKNAKLLDPNEDALQGGTSVLIEGDKIKEVSQKPIKAPKADVLKAIQKMHADVERYLAENAGQGGR